ncbi:amine sulfotransferase-like [Mytilus californianus]|uniref:amine sulfotransferase-like n=1 Tax=Mytilus californianus TaxID=6549 RepID=UPI002247480A|nr:amine sulfotransferase-like [Mytilus californianus]
MESANKDMKSLGEKIRKMGGPFMYDNVMWPPFPGLCPDSEKKFKEKQDMECRDTDVFICSFPKAGTNWTHEVLSMLISQSTSYNLWVEQKGLLEICDPLDILTKIPSPRLFMTHMPYRYLPSQLQNGKGKIVYVQRNPKDLFVSLYNFEKGKSAIGKHLSWEEFFEKKVIKDEGVLYGGWYQHTKEWEKQLGHNNILQLYYEDMKKDLVGNIFKIADFLETSCSKELAETIAEKCSFDNLKANRIDPTSFMTEGGQSTLYRKGQVGDWKNWFTVSQNEIFDRNYRDVMKGTTLNFINDL